MSLPPRPKPPEPFRPQAGAAGGGKMRLRDMRKANRYENRYHPYRYI